ncbi:MAG: sensor histidine kinase N-terminal domain-containing protein [Phycisphaerae bacterium]|jgi:heavy metal sensor kinase
MGSIRRRLIAGALVATAALLSAGGVALDRVLRATLVSEFDATLAARARTLAALVEQDEGLIEMELPPELEAGAQPEAGPEYFELQDSDGRVVRRSKSLSQGEAASPLLPPAADAAVAWTMPGGGAARAAGVRFVPRSDDSTGDPESPAPAAMMLVVARGTAALDRLLARLRWSVVGVAAAVSAAAACVLLWVVHRGLSPVRVIARQIEGVQPEKLTARIDMRRAPRELAPLVQKLNDLLARLESAFERERAFAADAAHELRTPIAGLRASLEVALTRPRPAAELRAAIEDGLQSTRRMQGLVEALLALARLEAGHVSLRPESFDLAELLRHCGDGLVDTARRRRVEVSWSVPGCLLIRADRVRLAQVLGNLLDNAVSHADEGGWVEVAAERRPGAVAVSIANAASGLAAEELPRMFDRFWRGDASRHDAGTHFGLGLPLARRLVAVLGGEISTELTAPGVFRVCLVLPEGAVHDASMR